MTRTPHLTSDGAACCWIPLFPLRCETARQPELASLPVALVGPDDTRRVWQVSPLARHAGVKPGMTVSQAIGLCPALKLCEPDPVHYDAQFSRLLAALGQVSPVIEPAELGLAYIGTDGLEGLYGAPEKIVEAIKRGMRNAERGTDGEGPLACSAFPLPRSAFRVGWGRGKFVSWVAATRARPGEAVIVPVGGEARFLAAQPLAALPLDSDTHRRLRQLGVRTLGALAALPEEAVVSQFGRAGRRLGRLAAGRIAGRVGERIAAPLKTQLERSPPAGAVERLVVEFTAFAPGTAELQLFARDAHAAARAGRRRALRTAAQEIKLRLKRSLLYHVIEVQPWSR